MQTYTINPVEPPASPSQLTAYKTLRLTSLWSDPKVFLATYAREVTFSDDDWRERLDSPFGRTFLASVVDTPQEQRNVSEGVQDSGWVGMATVIGPSDAMMSCSILDPFRDAKVTAHWEMYGMYAVWVHPTHRGQGVGARLIRACLEWAQTNVDPKFRDKKGGDFEKVVALHVYNDNAAARALYFGIGFTDLHEVASKEGEKWMSVKLEKVD